MIFSRTATEQDAINLKVQENIISYLQLPNSIDNVETSMAKFWEYSLLIEVIKFYNLQNDYVLNIVRYKPDDVLNKIAELHNIKLTQMSLLRFSRLPININRYGVISIFGSMEYSDNEYLLLDKASKHLKMGSGCLIITTDNTNNPNKRRVLDVNDLTDMSFFLEQNGYDFCSDEELGLVDYNNKSSLHSLVMQRLGN